MFKRFTKSFYYLNKGDLILNPAIVVQVEAIKFSKVHEVADLGCISKKLPPQLPKLQAYEHTSYVVENIKSLTGRI